jgi:radical SAM-linked protein
LLVIKFRVFGSARFLSHAETLRVFHRACARAGLDLLYSEGFNPRPALSLPLPRSVGLACQDETCCLRLRTPNDENLKEKLSEQMPAGFELTSAERLGPEMSFQRGTAVYEISITKDESVEPLKERVCRLLANDSLKLQRRLNAHGRTKMVDVRGYLDSIEVIGRKVIVNAQFSPQGSVRVDEILNLLGINVADLDGPVTRTKVLWEFMLKAKN